MGLPRELVIQLAEELMGEHGLQTWSFKLDHAKNRLGACDYVSRTLSLSKHLVKNGDEAVIRETVLHEIAHALVGPGHGHDVVWQAQARKLGVDPVASYRGDHAAQFFPRAKWALTCSNCATVVAERHRRRMRSNDYACARCGPTLGRLHWVEREL